MSAIVQEDLNVTPLNSDTCNLNIDRWQIDQVFMSGRSKVSHEVKNKDEWIDIAKRSYYKIIRDYIHRYPRQTKMKLEIVQVFRSAILDYGFKILNNDDHHPCEYQFGSVIVENCENVRLCPSLRYEKDDIFNIGVSYFTQQDIFN